MQFTNMERISRHQMFLEMAEVAAKRSTCFRANVGAILVHKNNIMSMGYNGPPAKQEHCTGNKCPLTNEGGCSRSIHAEQNAIERLTVGIKDASLYCTHMPCIECAKLISKHSIKQVFYRNKYRCEKGIIHLLEKGVFVFRITESGFIIDERTKQIVSFEKA
mgnify:CR=1 FL=1